MNDPERMDYLIDGCRMPSCNSTVIKAFSEFLLQTFMANMLQALYVGLNSPNPKIKPKCCDGTHDFFKVTTVTTTQTTTHMGDFMEGMGNLGGDLVRFGELGNHPVWVGEIESTTSDGNPFVTGGVVFDGKQVTIYMHFLVPTFNLPVTVSYDIIWVILLYLFPFVSWHHSITRFQWELDIIWLYSWFIRKDLLMNPSGWKRCPLFGFPDEELLHQHIPPLSREILLISSLPLGTQKDLEFLSFLRTWRTPPKERRF